MANQIANGSIVAASETAVLQATPRPQVMDRIRSVQTHGPAASVMPPKVIRNTHGMRRL